jgi:hypothetical protein
MARLRIQWRSATQIAPQAVTTGEQVEEKATPTSMRAEKPMMIYITSDDPTDSITRKLEDVVFANEAVGIGSKFFDTIKVSPGNADQDRLLSENGRHTPRLVFVTREFKVTGTLQKKQLSAGKLLKAMKSLARKEYKNNFERMVRDYTKLLNELDRLEGRKAKLSDDRARLQAKPSASKAKKLARTEKEYEADVKTWEDKERKLLEMLPKTEDKPAAEA